MKLFSKSKNKPNKKSKKQQVSLLGDKKFRLLVALLIVVGTIAILGPTRIGYRKDSQAAAYAISPTSTFWYVTRFSSDRKTAEITMMADYRISKADIGTWADPGRNVVAFRIREGRNCATAFTTPWQKLNYFSGGMDDQNEGLLKSAGYTTSYHKIVKVGTTYYFSAKSRDVNGRYSSGLTFCGTTGWTPNVKVLVTDSTQSMH